MTANKKPASPNYFAQYRPHGDTLKAKCARSQNATERPKPSLPKLKFMELPLDDDDDRGRS